MRVSPEQFDLLVEVKSAPKSTSISLSERDLAGIRVDPNSSDIGALAVLNDHSSYRCSMVFIEIQDIPQSMIGTTPKSELPPKLLKAAALIAYHQPMPQSRLVELLGQRAYDHIRELAQAGLIGRRRDGNTRRLTTTRRFSEMFGCPHTDRKKVRAWFREMVTSSGMLEGMEGKLALRDEVDTEGGVQTTLDIAED